jgi:ATP-binding cassette, subfamily C (CFTR/MRP), member 1
VTRSSNVSLVIRSAERVAVCGRTGSCKLSLLLTLFRLLDPDSGSITLDGMDISNVVQDTLRPRLIAVPQEPLLFPGTLRSNLSSRHGNGSEILNDEQILDALEKVELSNVVSLHGGLDTDIYDISLSQGQKRLLYLARAILQNRSSAVLVLDEAMSAVDQQTEDILVRVLETEFANHTVILWPTD